jgi:hypothetical protein
MLGFNALGDAPVGMSGLSQTSTAPPAQQPTVSAVIVTPATAILAGGAQQQFSTSVLGLNNPSQAVTWTKTAGSIDANGLFTAPATSSVSQVFNVTATSILDGSKSGYATVTVPAADPGPGPSSGGQLVATIRFIPLGRYRLRRGLN